MTTLSGTGTDRFLAEVREGLSARPKRLPCRWLYDAEGSRLFEAIMTLPGYYLSRCEADILDIHKDGILRASLAAGPVSGGRISRPDARRSPLNVVDLGAGNGAKTRILLRHFLERGALAEFLPVDICPDSLDAMAQAIGHDLPGLPVRPLAGDWLEVLSGLAETIEGPKLVLFLGSNVGNYDREEAIGFLTALGERLTERDALLIGFDLRKEPSRVLRAYSDATGVTARFNLNLLDRINRELGGDFRREDFAHRAVYEEASGAARSYLVARRAHSVTLAADGFRADFEAGEAIHTETSWKYSVEETDAMARQAGFDVLARFRDPTGSFLDTLWRPRTPAAG